MRKLFLAMTMTALLAPMTARADALQDVGTKLDVVNTKLSGLWNFLGSSAPETGKALAAPDQEAAPTVHLTPIAVVAHTPAMLGLTDIHVPDLSVLPAVPATAAAAPSDPWVEKSLKKIFCVEYARAVSGLSIFGDAKYWWSRAQNLYARTSKPLEEAVMVFSGSARLRSGHVAVVTNIVSPRQIIVDQANWMNKGEIDHATPVMDVSAKNDWSKVRVWDVPSHQFGSRVYAISGFILKPAIRQASND